jgi:hypothetical protein
MKAAYLLLAVLAIMSAVGCEKTIHEARAPMILPTEMR